MVSDSYYCALRTSLSFLKMNLLFVSQEQSLFSADFKLLLERELLTLHRDVAEEKTLINKKTYS